MKKFTAIDLFCGCGGVSCGFIRAGIEVIAGIDIWNVAIDSYKSNFNHAAICADLKLLSPEEFAKRYINKEIDIITASPPCQGFSISGKRNEEDDRNFLFYEYFKYIDYFNPKLIMMENVIGILSMKNNKGEKIIDLMMFHLEKKYNCILCKLYASDFEVPQNRRRVILFGIRKDLNKMPIEPHKILKINERIPVRKILLLENEVDNKYYLSQRAINGIKHKKEKSLKSGKGFGAQFLKLDSPSYTIPARYWKDGYDALVKYDENKIRRLTILELKRIQTFDDNFILSGSNKDKIIQIGNAVPCRFAYHLGKHIINMLR